MPLFIELPVMRNLNYSIAKGPMTQAGTWVDWTLLWCPPTSPLLACRILLDQGYRRLCWWIYVALPLAPRSQLRKGDRFETPDGRLCGRQRKWIPSPCRWQLSTQYHMNSTSDRLWMLASGRGRNCYTFEIATGVPYNRSRRAYCLHLVWAKAYHNPSELRPP